MADKSRSRLTIEVDGLPRRLLSISHNNKNDVFLSFTGGEHLGPIPKEQPALHQYIGAKIVEERTTIHPRRVGHELTMIHHHLRLASGKDIDGSQYTAARDEKDVFCVILSRRYVDLSDM